MVIFDYEKYIAQIKETGISATEKNANQKISLLMQYYIDNTDYSKGVIFNQVKKIAKEYFDGLSTDIVNKELNIIFEKVKQHKQKTPERKTITLYESEMQKIADLKDDKLMRLAFACLVLHKFCGQFTIDGKTDYYSCVADSPADAYRIADLTSISGTKKDKLWYDLKQAGMVNRFRVDNKAFNYNSRTKQICGVYMACPYCVDLLADKSNEIVFKTVFNYDNVLNYLYYFLGDKNIIECSDCGMPIIKNVKSVCLCADCASRRKKESDRLRYKRKTA